jgi:hypothetical protein
VKGLPLFNLVRIKTVVLCSSCRRSLEAFDERSTAKERGTNHLLLFARRTFACRQLHDVQTVGFTATACRGYVNSYCSLVNIPLPSICLDMHSWTRNDVNTGEMMRTPEE